MRCDHEAPPSGRDYPRLMHQAALRCEQPAVMIKRKHLVAAEVDKLIAAIKGSRSEIASVSQTDALLERVLPREH